VTARPALDGIRILDLSRVLAGPLAAQVLADLGADVIKVERPDRGDDTRQWVPPVLAVRNAGHRGVDESVYFWTCNRGKRSLAVDLASASGQALVRRLAAEADVVIENYKVDTLERFGLGYPQLRALNPRLIYCSITGFGQTGPYRHQPGYDTIVQALGGLMSLTGNEDGSPGAGPRKAGIAVADQLTATYAVIAVLAALHERHASGGGQHIDLSLLDVQVAALTNLGNGFLATGQAPRRMGNRLGTVCPSDSYECLDGPIMVIVGNDAQFARLCTALEVPALANDPRFLSNVDRLRNREDLDPLLRHAFGRLSVAQCRSRLEAAGVPAAPINDLAQVFDDPQVRARGLVREVVRADGSRVRVVGNPIRMSRSPVLDARPAPKLGEHSSEIGTGWASCTLAGLPNPVRGAAE
jgi:crotonobetainyl-CoA:carnitine CoA-transferase CaiB-like acyl-CoA transferase